MRYIASSYHLISNCNQFPPKSLLYSGVSQKRRQLNRELFSREIGMQNALARRRLSVVEDYVQGVVEELPHFTRGTQIPLCVHRQSSARCIKCRAVVNTGEDIEDLTLILRCVIDSARSRGRLGMHHSMYLPKGCQSAARCGQVFQTDAAISSPTTE
jgi:hypothetical protein